MHMCGYVIAHVCVHQVCMHTGPLLVWNPCAACWRSIHLTQRLSTCFDFPIIQLLSHSPICFLSAHSCCTQETFPITADSSSDFLLTSPHKDGDQISLCSPIFLCTITHPFNLLSLCLHSFFSLHSTPLCNTLLLLLQQNDWLICALLYSFDINAAHSYFYILD